MWLLTGSLPMFTVWGIRVRIHVSLIVFIVLTLLFSEVGQGSLGATNALTSMSILFISVLLHEFGHCFGARIMGGTADDILMWPLGGLAFVSPPHRWWPSFVSTACGPGVNVLICLVTGIAIAVLNQSASAIPWFPMRDGLRTYVPHDSVTYYLWWIFLVNYALLAFNLLLLFYPFDGGRMVQELLWAKFGYHKSMMFATAVGMVGAVVVAGVGLATLSFMLTLIAAFGFMTCYRQRAALRSAGPAEDDSDLYAAAYESSSPLRVKKASNWARNVRKRQAAEQAEQAQVDAILAKVSASGMHSLSWWEKRTLRKATEHQRQRDQQAASTLKRRGF